MSPVKDAKQHVSPRWWPLAVILVIVAGTLAWIWWDGDADDRQSQVMSSEGILMGGLLAVAIWFVLLSRLALRTKVVTAAAVAVLVGTFLALFRYDGVDGDLIPVFSWRWGGPEHVITGEPLSGIAGDWPQFRGVRRDGTVAGVRLATDWDASPPKLVWRRPVGRGWSGFAVAGNLAITQEQHGDEERVVCYALEDGDEVWSASNDVAYRNKLAGSGPRATPTVVGDRVYTAGATGVINAFELATGKRIWSKDLLDEYDGEVPEWGMSASPLIVDGMLIVGTTSKAPSLVALDVETGEPRWAAGSDYMGYASAELTTLGGRRQIIAFNQGSVAGHDVTTGDVLWTYDWRARQPNCAQPLAVGDDRLLVSSGYGVGSQLLRLSPGDDGGFAATRVWRSLSMKAKFASMIQHGGSVFGLDDGTLACIDVETGKRRWKSGRYGHGQIIRVGEHLVVSEEMGEIVVVALDESEARELTRFRVFDRKTWNPPALAGSRLLWRNDEEAALYLLPIAE